MSITAAEKSVDPPAPGAASAQAVRRDNAWIWQVTLLSVLLGGMLALAVRTTEQSRTTPGSSSRLGLLAALIDREKQESEALQQEVAALECTLRARSGRHACRPLDQAVHARLADRKDHRPLDLIQDVDAVHPFISLTR